MSKTIKISFCSVIVALSICLLFLTGIFTSATYALPALSGILFVAIVIEINSAYALLSYFVSSIIAFLFVPDKLAVFVFIAIFGYYPVLKKHIEKIKSFLIQILLKLLLINSVCLASFFIAKLFFTDITNQLSIFGVSLPWLFLLIANVIFIVYDYAITGLIIMYMNKLHPVLYKIIKH